MSRRSPPPIKDHVLTGHGVVPSSPPCPHGCWYVVDCPDCTTATFAPGPWRVVQHREGVYVIGQASKEFQNGRPIARVSAGPAKKCLENARLIAAAPELYQACIDAEQQLTDDIEAACWEDDAKDSRYPLRECLRTALAKAEGRR